MDKVQKHKSLTSLEAKRLRDKGLIEGKRPLYFISARVAQSTGQKANYTRNRAFSNEQYFDWIVKGINDHKSLSRNDIHQLLYDKLSDLYTPQQKKIKINNIIQRMRKGNLIKNNGTDRNPVWVAISPF